MPWQENIDSSTKNFLSCSMQKKKDWEKANKLIINQRVFPQPS